MSDKYPIAEIFTSPQGEGMWTGALMTFVRLAGCTVGRPYNKMDLFDPLLAPYQEKCTLYDGREFPCDTNYKRTESLTVADICDRVNVERVCITGGEPMMHDLNNLIEGLRSEEKYVHMETSGTIDIEPVRKRVDWICVSPKKGVLPQSIALADEIKVLVDDWFDSDRFEQDIYNWCTPGTAVYFQPVNGLHTINSQNVQRCIQLQKLFPEVRISIQMHKIMGVR